MRCILALDAALAGCSAGVVTQGALIQSCFDPAGQALALPSMVRDLLQHTGAAPDNVAVTVGPGSFTGLRAALALAHGIGLAYGIPVLGVSMGAAMAYAATPGRELWVAIDTKRGRVFIERDGTVRSVALDALPVPDGKVAIAGDAAVAVAARLAASGSDVQLLGLRRPDPLGIALAAIEGRVRVPQPLYVDPPAVVPGPPGRPAPL